MKVVLLTSDSVYQRRFARRLASASGIEVAGLIVQHQPSTMNLVWAGRALFRDPMLLANKVGIRARFGEVVAGIQTELSRRFGDPDQPLGWPEAERLEVQEINGPDVAARIRGWSPDLITVFGTRLIRTPIFETAPPLGILNLHTGISPFYKGVPNCTMWALSNREPQYIGSTIHVLDPGIDSGAILLTEQTPIDEDDTAETLVAKTIETGQQMYLRVLEAFQSGARPRPVPQRELGAGRTYLSRDWGCRDMAKAVGYVRSGALAQWVRDGRPGLESVRLVDAVGRRAGAVASVG